MFKIRARTRWLLLALLCCATSAQAAPVPLELIDRPLTLPAMTLQPSLLGNLTSFQNNGAENGGVLALGIDYGLGEGAQLGLAAAFPIAPNVAFGSVIGTGVFPVVAPIVSVVTVRLDLGYERLGTHGLPDSSTDGTALVGIGFPFKVRLGPRLALAMWETDSIDFTHYFNLGSGGTSSYFGSTFPMHNADLVSVDLQGNGPAVIGLNFPLKLILQADPHLAFALRAGYSASFFTGGGTSGSEHFLPLGADVIVSPTARIDLGASFTLGGYLTSTSDANALNGGYAGLLFAELWLRFRVG